MAHSLSFRFVDDDLNGKLIAILGRFSVKYTLDDNGVIHYSPDDEALVGNELIPSIRGEVFPSWQIVSCPKNWSEIYKQYMKQHTVPFAEELIDKQLCFLIPRKYRPHSWRLENAHERKTIKLAR